ncbi:hypothetical protein [Mucilaginibacter pocheonensis]|uniref:Uncharacterized protein n=1 Tax=Mucilaginibacter pocheonensis TaxID=398050 RepID=A0ABU1TC27_9SPHI|nr:hypothetical protein [Mucilaginibacter pocheonensis]MDR6942936.1 hypothetical protein [Mucilaginibacter pocheonensis]
MDIDKFLLKDQLEQIKRSFIHRGWITVYKGGTTDPGDSTLIYACLIHRSHSKKSLESRSWDMQPGSEGKPAVISQMRDGEWRSEYHAFSDEGIEPLLFDKFFSHNKQRYFDISEDFVNYYKLYEELKSKQERQYFFIDEMGEMEEVIKIEAKEWIFRHA